MSTLDQYRTWLVSPTDAQLRRIAYANELAAKTEQLRRNAGWKGWA